MLNKILIRNFILAAALVSSVVLWAQIRHEKQKAVVTARPDGTPPDPDTATVDNTEGLKELDSIVTHYQQANLSLSGELYYYDNVDSSDVPDQKSAFTSIQTPEGSLYELDSVQTICTRNLTLIADKREKNISLFENEHEQAVASKANISAQIREFIGYIKTVDVKTKGQTKSLLIHFTDDFPANIAEYLIVYDAESYKIKKIRVEMTDGNLSDAGEIDMDSTVLSEDDELMLLDSADREISTNYYACLKTTAYEVIYRSEKTADAHATDISRFVEKRAEGYVPTGAYKDYEFQN